MDNMYYEWTGGVGFDEEENCNVLLCRKFDKDAIENESENKSESESDFEYGDDNVCEFCGEKENEYVIAFCLDCKKKMCFTCYMSWMKIGGENYFNMVCECEDENDPDVKICFECSNKRLEGETLGIF